LIAAPPMPINSRPAAIALAAALLCCGLSGCGTINEKLAAGMIDAIPAWAGGMPADVPPRPGSARYDEFMRERERKRLEVKTQPAQPAPSSQEAVH
jgi:hypothetical protein